MNGVGGCNNSFIPIDESFETIPFYCIYIMCSAVFPVLSLVPLGGGKSQLDDEERIVGAIVTNNPYVGHVVIVRMASGDIEAINLTVWKYQADAQAKVS